MFAVCFYYVTLNYRINSIIICLKVVHLAKLFLICLGVGYRIVIKAYKLKKTYNFLPVPYYKLD